MTTPADDLAADFRPLVRWWWFEDAVPTAEVEEQLDWVAAMGFGGVEVAWLNRNTENHGEAPAFLTPAWAAMMAHAARAARARGLRMDFTFGSQWPFGGNFVTEEDSTQTWNGPSRYYLQFHWKMEPAGEPPRVLNHLDRGALHRYAATMASGLGPAIREAAAGATALFCDSWEVPTSPPMWSENFAVRFEKECGYDITHLMNYLEYHTHARYDYRKVLSKLVIEEFYRPFTAECHALGTLSRSQCHGAPCDIVAAYAATDIPETETILFDAHFTSFAASAGVLADRQIISAESFTALYGLGWQAAPGHAVEEAADVKLLADAMFAHGVNQIIWHGMPLGKNRFGATCHVAPDGALAPHLPELNRYLDGMSAALREGRPRTDVAVYLPLEDQWMRHLLPDEIMRPSAHYHWELQYVRFPEELRGFQPCWITGEFLPRCRVTDGRIIHDTASFEALWLDCEWLDLGSLRELIRLAEAGGRIMMRQSPQEPGYVRHEEFPTLMDRLETAARAGVGDLIPLVTGDDVPEFRCRIIGETSRLFFAHPATRQVTYPMRQGQAAAAGPTQRMIVLHVGGLAIPLTLDFGWNESLLVEIDGQGGISIQPCACGLPVPDDSAPFPRDHRYPGYVRPVHS